MIKTYTAEWRCNECDTTLSFVTNREGSYSGLDRRTFDEMAWDFFAEAGWEDFGGFDAYHCDEHAEGDS